ncbi:hypothetical protein [Microbulbifer variabilis]|uniref:hypothetical protein n=1 Tax=Microbulbifer variabilis TaxID=266805 RepID=UPI001CFEE07D|nr:hypothetical protein [Microbulbifer variabilis]
MIDGDRTRSVLLGSGETVAAGKAIANIGPKLLFSQMVDEQHLEPEFHRRVHGFRIGSGIVIGPTINYLEQAYVDATQYG